MIVQTLLAVKGQKSKLSDHMLEFDAKEQEVTEDVLRGIFGQLVARGKCESNGNVSR